MVLTKRIAHVSYDGTDYHGFSISPGKRTIQQTIEETVSRIVDIPSLCFPIDFTSRTDKGVHAIDQVITFMLPDYFDDKKFLLMVNQRLPQDIRFQQLSAIPDTYDLREKVLAKKYQYTLSNENKNPFISRYAWTLPTLPDYLKLSSFLQLMVGEHDFTSLAKESYRYHSTVCRVNSIVCDPKTPSAIIITIEGTRFLYNMVRRMIGFSVFLTFKNKSLCFTFEELVTRYFSQTNMRAPSSGLTLLKVILDDDSSNI